MSETLTDTAAESPYVNPDAPLNGRRLAPATVDGILRAWSAGVPSRVIADAYSVSRTVVHRVVERSKDDPRLAPDAATLSEVADAERELRESDLNPAVAEMAIEMLRAGHLLRRDRERKARR